MKRLAAALLLTLAAPLAAQQDAPIVAWQYTVQPGDTFAAIARRWGVDMATLGAANGIASPYVIRIGQVLRRPEQQRVPLAPPMPRVVPSRSPKPAASQPAKVLPRPAPPPRPAPSPRPRIGLRESDAPRMAWPTEGAVIVRFGEKVSGIPSNGIDLAALYGTKVRAAAAGTVLYAGREPERFGQLILIDHGGGFVTAYAYLGTMTVKEGGKVTAGERIALVGKSGEALRPSVHFELRRNNVPRDPELYLPNRF